MKIINLAALEELEISCHDIKGAFLVPWIKKGEEPIFMRLEKTLVDLYVKEFPEAKQFIDVKGCITFRLQKYLYGLPQAGYHFYKHLEATLMEKMGFTQLRGDKCCWIRGKGDDKVIVAAHVDDLIAVGKPKARKQFQSELEKAYEVNSQNGPKLSYIGLTISKSQKDYVVSMEGYRKELVSRFEQDILNCKTHGMSPAGEGLMHDDGPSRDNPTVDKLHYTSLIMSIMYIARLSRPDLLFATTYLASKSQSPTRRDYLSACRVLKYIQVGPNYGVRFKHGVRMSVNLYADASHGIHTDGKGHAGIVITLGSGFIHARSSKCKLTTLSSTETESVALCEAATYAYWVRAMLFDFGYRLTKPIKTHQDNDATVYLTSRDGNLSRNKHVMIRRNFAKEAVDQDIIRLVRCSTDVMPADAMTKPKTPRALKEDMKIIGLEVIIE